MCNQLCGLSGPGSASWALVDGASSCRQDSCWPTAAHSVLSWEPCSMHEASSVGSHRSSDNCSWSGSAFALLLHMIASQAAARCSALYAEIALPVLSSLPNWGRLHCSATRASGPPSPCAHLPSLCGSHVASDEEPAQSETHSSLVTSCSPALICRPSFVSCPWHVRSWQSLGRSPLALPTRSVAAEAWLTSSWSCCFRRRNCIHTRAKVLHTWHW